MKLNYVIEDIDSCLREGYLELTNRLLRMLVYATSVFLFVFFFFLNFWQWLVSVVIQAGSLTVSAPWPCVQPAAKLSINSRPAPTPTLHAYAYGWPQTATRRKQLLHNHRQHRWPDPVPSSG